MEQEDFKDSKLNVIKDGKYLFFINYTPETKLYKMTTNSLQIKYKKELMGVQKIKFINDEEIIGIIKNFEGNNSKTITVMDNQNKDSESTWSLIKIHCDFLNNNRSLEHNKGVLEISRSDKEIISFEFKQNSEGEEIVAFLREDLMVVEIQLLVEIGEDEYYMRQVDSNIIYSTNFEVQMRQVSTRNKKMFIVPTVEFIEANLQVMI